jgi:iron complex outermembrane receptor protein
MNQFEKWMATTALAAASMLAAAPAQAQTADSEGRGVEEVIVTARKTAENIQDIPVAVTAFTAESIDRLNIQGLEDVARFTSGFSFENFSGAFSAPVLRGQTQTRIDLLVQNTASFFNGVYLQRGYMVDSSLLDVERIEVIKGPQSALYGRNAFSGAINTITKKPGDEFDLRLKGTVGADDLVEVSGSVSGPIIPGQLGLLVAAGYSEFNGTWENNHPLAAQGTGTKDNLGGHTKDSLLVAASFTPVDAISIDLAYSRLDLEVEHQPAYTISTAGAGALVNSTNCSPVLGVNRFFCGEIPATPTLVPGETRRPGLVVDPRATAQVGVTNVFSAKIGWDITENFSAFYQFGHAESDVTARGSPARDPTVATVRPTLVPPFAPLTSTVFDSQPIGGFESDSHEVRVEYQSQGLLKRLMVGGFVSESTDDASGRAEYAAPNSLAPPTNFFSLANATRLDDVQAYFGLISLGLTDRLTVTGEVRYNEEELTLQVRQTPPPFSTTPAQPGAPILRTQANTFDFTTPRVAIDYKLTDENLIYVTVGQGVKSGGQNVPGLDPAQDIYEPEENWTYELGSKNEFFDRRLLANAAVFYIEWEGIQGSVARNYPASGRVLNVSCFAACAVPAPGSPAAVIIGNLGEATVQGIELDGVWLATESLTLNGAFSYVDATYNDGQISQRIATSGNCDGIVCATTVLGPGGRPVSGANIGGNQVERAPSTKAALGAQYDWTQPGWDLEWSVRGDVTYQSKQYADELNLAFVPARTLVDGSISVTKGRFTGRLWGKNLFDEEYVSSAFFLVGTGGPRSVSYVPFLGEKRTVGFTLSADF